MNDYLDAIFDRTLGRFFTMNDDNGTVLGTQWADRAFLLIVALITQAKTQAATLAVIRSLSQRHRETLRQATGISEFAA